MDISQCPPGGLLNCKLKMSLDLTPLTVYFIGLIAILVVLPCIARLINFLFLEQKLFGKTFSELYYCRRKEKFKIQLSKEFSFNKSKTKSRILIHSGIQFLKLDKSIRKNNTKYSGIIPSIVPNESQPDEQEDDADNRKILISENNLSSSRSKEKLTKIEITKQQDLD